MKRVEIGLISLFFSVNVMAQCTDKTNKEFLSIYSNPPYEISKLETIYKSCKEAPVKMLLHLAKGDAFLKDGEVEYAFKEYSDARREYVKIKDEYIEYYKNIGEELEKKKKRYSYKTADEITRSMTTRSMTKSRGAELTTEYLIENLPLNFKSNSFEIKEGVNLKQALEIYKVLKSKKYRGKSIRIIGYTDTSGRSSHNLNLSENRAKSLIKYLKSKGLKNKFIYDGKSESKPICIEGKIISKENYEYECSIKEDKYRSRRVNITIGDE